MIVKLFSSGTHRTPHPKKEWTNEDVATVFENSKKMSPSKIPFVVGHKKKYPIVGELAKEALDSITQGDKQLIVFDKNKAEFSSELTDDLKAHKSDKLSVRVKMPEMYIDHIAFVGKAAIEELNSATFNQGEDHHEYAVFELSETALFSVASDSEKGLMEKVKSIVTGLLIDYPLYQTKSAANFSQTQTNQDMTDEEKQELDRLRTENAAFKASAEKQVEELRKTAIDAVFSDEKYKGKIVQKNEDMLRSIAEKLVPTHADFSASADPLKEFKNLLDTMPVLVNDKGVATFESAAGETDDEVETDPVKLRKKALQELG